MLGRGSEFPAFDDRRSMSESEQDALIGRIEVARRPRAIVLRALSLALAAVVAGAAFVIRWG
jgi:hypothetical protein